MSYLFIIENNIAKPNPETLLISPFKEIWERDDSQDKGKAIKEFSYTEFMVSKMRSNPYAGFSDEQRHDRLAMTLFDDEDWTPDRLVEQAMIKISEFQKEGSATYTYYLSLLKAAEKMKQFFTDFDMDELNDKGQRVWKPRDITSAMSDTDKILQNLHSAKEKVEQELFESTRTRGNRTVNIFEV